MLEPVLRVEEGPGEAVLDRRFNLMLIALSLLLTFFLAGCAVPESPIGQLDNAAAAAGQIYVGSEIARIVVLRLSYWSVGYANPWKNE